MGTDFSFDVLTSCDFRSKYPLALGTKHLGNAPSSDSLPLAFPADVVPLALRLPALPSDSRSRSWPFAAPRFTFGTLVPLLQHKALRRMIQELPRVHSSGRYKVVSAQESVIQDFARQIAQLTQTLGGEQERRSQPRIPLPRLIALTPLRNDTLQPAREPTYVVGKNLAPLGLDFFHHETIAERFAIVTLERAQDCWVHFLMKITWCRFLKQGWYDSGGRFIKVIEWTRDE